MDLVRRQYSWRGGTVWTARERLHKLPGMLPWNSIERLRDHFGDYVIVITCRVCRHTCEVMPASLAHRCRNGWDEPLAGIVSRFRCRCGGKSIDVQVGFNHKPRGWSKNPS